MSVEVAWHIALDGTKDDVGIFCCGLVGGHNPVGV